MAAYGTSKYEQRQLSKAEGVDLTKGQIYSYNTMRTYQNEVKRYWAVMATLLKRGGCLTTDIWNHFYFHAVDA